MAGNRSYFNFLPRYVRWYVRLQRYKWYIYIVSIAIFLFAIVSIVVLIEGYNDYKAIQRQWLAIQNNEDNQRVLKEYESLQQLIHKTLQRKSSYDTQYIAITLLDGAMTNHGNVTIQNITFTDDGFSMVGIANSDESYQSYMQYVQSHLIRWICNGKQDIQQDSGYTVFHMDGHPKEHEHSHAENNRP